MSVCDVDSWCEQNGVNYDWLHNRTTYFCKATEDVVKAVRALHKAGFSRKTIETYFWLSSAFVASIIANPDSPSLPISQGSTTVDEGKICALYRAGWKVPDIAGDCATSETVVHETLLKHFGGKR